MVHTNPQELFFQWFFKTISWYFHGLWHFFQELFKAFKKRGIVHVMFSGATHFASMGVGSGGWCINEQGIYVLGTQYTFLISLLFTDMFSFSINIPSAWRTKIGITRKKTNNRDLKMGFSQFLNKFFFFMHRVYFARYD